MIEFAIHGPSFAVGILAGWALILIFAALSGFR
jgi:hypothetical protein